MAGYLGKISAVVAVNTADFAPKLNQAGRDVEKFARGLERSLASMAQGSARQFGSIYTEVQKLERALYAAGQTKLDFSGIKGFEGKTFDEAANQMRRMHEVASQLSAPLAATLKTVESLAIEVRGSLHPALVATQAAVEAVQTDVQLFGSVSKDKFDEATKAVERYNAVAMRASEASAMAGAIPTGREFRFAQPRLFAALGGATEAQKAGEKEFGQSAGVKAMSAAVSHLAQRAAQAAAAVDNAVLLGESSKAAALQGEVDALSAALERMTAKMSSDVKAKQDSKNATDALAKSEAAYRQTITGEAQNLAQLQARYDSLVASVKKLEDAERAAFDASEGAGLAGVRGTLASGDVAGLASGNAAIDSAEKMVAKQVEAREAADEARKAIEKQHAAIKSVADSIGRSADPVERLNQAVSTMNANVAKLEGKSVYATAQRDAAKVRRDIENSLAAAGGGQLSPAELARLTDRADDLSNRAVAAGAKPPTKKTANDLFGPPLLSAERSADLLKGKIRGLQSEFDKMAPAAQGAYAGPINKLRNDLAALPANATRAQVLALVKDFERLESAIKKINTKTTFNKNFAAFIDETAPRQYANQFDAIRSKMVELGAAADGGVSRAVEALGGKLQKASTNGTLGVKQTREEIRKLMLDVGRAAVAENLMTKAQSKSFLGGVMRSGDIGRFGADKIGLALNQTAYVIDDFMSSSGGLDMKMRAIGNNLTQIGFIVGGTAGLFASLGTIVATNVGIMLYKWINGGKESQDVAKALSATFSEQTSVVEKLSQAYGSLSQSISASSNAQKGVAQGGSIVGFSIESLRSRQGQAAETGQGVIDSRTRENQFRRELEQATTQAQAAAAAALIEVERRRQEQLTQFGGAGVERDAEDRALRDRMAEQVSANARDWWWGKAEAQLEKDFNDLDQRVRAGEAAMGGLTDRIAAAGKSWSDFGASRLEEATRLLADALSAGVPGAIGVQSSLDAMAVELQLAERQMNDALAIKDEARRREAVTAAKARIEAAGGAAGGQSLNMVRGMVSAGMLERRATSAEVLSRFPRSPMNDQSRSRLAAAAEESAMAAAMLATSQTRLARATAIADGLRRELNENERTMSAATKRRLVDDIIAAENAEDARRAERDRAAKLAAAADAADRRIAAEAEYTLALRESTRSERQRVARGRLAAMDPRTRQAIEFANGEGGDVAAAAGDIIDPAARARFIQDYFSGKMREQFAATFAAQAADRELAITRGGQARALEASDITTDPGVREINRLIRGQDASKDADNQEMRQQTDLLKIIADGIKQATGQVVDFKF